MPSVVMGWYFLLGGATPGTNPVSEPQYACMATAEVAPSGSSSLE